MSATLAPALSARERWAALPEGTRAELIDNELIIAPAPQTLHNRIQLRLYDLLSDYLESTGQTGIIMTPIVDVIFSPGIVLQPDFLFLSEEKSHFMLEDAVHGAPDLVAEIVSPSNAKHDIVTKRYLYEQFGVKEYWIIDPKAQTFDVLALSEAGTYETLRLGQGSKVESRLLPGLILELNELFKR